MWRVVAAAGLLLGTLWLPPSALAFDPTLVSVRRAADVSLPTAHSFVTVSWDTEVNDPAGAWSSGTNIVVPAAWDGMWATGSAWVEYEAISNSTVRRAILVLNGGTWAIASTLGAGAAVASNLVFSSRPLILATGDVITLQVSTGTNGTDVTEAAVWLEVWGSAQDGAPGPTGPPGADGAAGPTGPPGEACPTPLASAEADCIVEVSAFTGTALDTLNLQTFTLVIAAGLGLICLAFIAMASMRR